MRSCSASRLTMLRVALSIGLALGAACARRPSGGLDAWLAPVGCDHPLAGRIWDVAAQRTIGRRALAERLPAARYVLLGEKHDNADHHRLQAWMIASLAAAGRRPTVALEMISADRRDALAAVLAAPAPSVAEVEAAIDGAGGWTWDLYVPILATALEHRLPIVAADLAPATVAMLRDRGEGGLAPEVADRLGLARVAFSAADRTALAAAIREAHCGMAPEGMIDRSIAVQRARDGALARALVDATDAGADGAVLIAGVDHVRRDRAVPRYLAAWAPDAPAVSVALVEVELERREAVDTLAALYGPSVPFDYVWFTPRVDALDPCAKFREQLERLRATPGGGAGGR